MLHNGTLNLAIHHEKGLNNGILLMHQAFFVSLKTNSKGIEQNE